MLLVLFLAAAVAMIAGIVRPPAAPWQRTITWLAGIVMLAVLIAWGIEYVMQTPVG
jgi:branched-subunit amino acid ABC-type transport system permease component